MGAQAQPASAGCADRHKMIPMNKLADTPKPPYYAVVFSSQRTGDDADGYGKMADRMWELAAQQTGYLGVEMVHSDDGFGMTVSYWASLDAIRNWREQAEHKIAQAQGREKWYEKYKLRISLVETEYSFERTAGSSPAAKLHPSGLANLSR